MPGSWRSTSSRAMDDEGVIRIICPPAICLPMVAAALAGTGVAVGAQNVHAEGGGAYTGEISAAMVASVRHMGHRRSFRAPSRSG